MAICAAREGVAPTTYYYTRPFTDFAASTMAWVESWAVPARMLMGSKKTPATRGTGRPNHAAPASSLVNYWPSPRGGRKVYNLDEMLPIGKSWDPATVQRLKVSMGPALKKR